MRNAVGTKNDKPDVLVFCRDYLIPDFKDTLAPQCLHYNFHFLTDGRFAGVADTRSRFYDRLESAKQLAGWSNEDESDAIARCRLLRGLRREKALKMLRAMGSVLLEELLRIKPAFVYAQMVDEYITYLLSEMARRLGIKYIGTCYSYFPNRIQVTEYWNGAPHNFRSAGDEEVRQTLETISQRTFRQNYQQKDTYTRWRHLVAMARYRVKAMVFPAIARVKRDRLNIHYACLPYVAERRHWSDFPGRYDFHQSWRNMLKVAVEENRRPVIYMPLGYFPESSIDYWIGNKVAIDYQNTVISICQRLTLQFNVVIKEHLHMLGARNSQFYRDIRAIPGVISVPPMEFSNVVLDLADAVVVGGGSVGVESYIRGKAIASFCDSIFWFNPSGARFLDLSELSGWSGVISELIAYHQVPSDDEKARFLQDCLQSTMRVDRPGRVWPIPNSEDMEMLLSSAKN